MQKFATTAPIVTVLDIPAGRIQFIAADRADSTVEVRPAVAGQRRDVAAAERVEVAYADGVLRIGAAKPAHRLLGSSGAVEITVALPAGSRIEAKLASGEVRGVGRLGEVVVESALGPVKLDEAAGVRLTLQSGDVTVGRLTGPALISAERGDLSIGEAVTGEVTLRTAYGHISVGAARGSAASLDAGTTFGRVHNALRNDEGAGAVLAIHATTEHGDITARSL
ncbi:DUF4097 family beta strand repeat-containing protein [Actinoplanes sp. NPDC051851]|uniref:DUF4097 family beta strand repeat-containing protein n=1 Tax=Actinoplanes sp. NPDC051851 TaxID=3154753 RepID=UPI003422FA2F